MIASDSRRRLLWILAIGWLAVFAMINGGMLTIEHAQYLLEGVGTGICSGLSSDGCSVTAGRFGSVFGVPVALLGFAASFVMVMLVMVAFLRRRLEHDAVRGMILTLATAFVLASLGMAAASFVEGRFCPFCVAWYGLNGLMWGCAWAVRDRPVLAALRMGFKSLLRPIGWLSVGVFALATTTSTLAYQYALGDLQAAQDAQVEGVCTRMSSGPLLSPEALEKLLQDSPRKIVGQERDGAVVRLVEITDLACPYCGRLWANVQEYAASASHPVEIVLAHFPLDSKCNRKVPEEFHPDACQAARAVTCADRQGQFGPMVAALHASDSLRENVISGIAMTVVPSFEDFQTCMLEEGFPKVIAQGIALAEAVELEGTPTLLVEGHRITGSLSPRAISRIVKCALEER